MQYLITDTIVGGTIRFDTVTQTEDDFLDIYDYRNTGNTPGEAEVEAVARELYDALIAGRDINGLEEFLGLSVCPIDSEEG